MATNGFLVSAPSHFVSAKGCYSHHYLALPLKPTKFQLSCYGSSSNTPLSRFSSSRRETLLRVSVVDSQQEENNPVLFEEKPEVEQFFQGNFDWEVSGNENREGESDGVVEAVGDSVDDDDYVEPPEEAKLFVGNLPYDVDSEKLAQIFDQAGVVEIAEVIYNRETDQSRGFGFVTMSTVEEADRAVNMLNRYDFSGRLLTVNKASPRGTQPQRAPRTYEPTYRVYVGNLPWSMNDKRLEELFSEHGKVVIARVVTDRETGKSRGFGFVTMSSESEMNDAIGNLDGQNLDGRAIRVNVAEERQRRGGF